MAQPNLRENVGDPLAFNAREQAPDRSLGLQGIRGNNSTNNALFREDISESLGRVGTLLGRAADENMDNAILQGKMDYMSGVTEEEMLAKGDFYGRQGYESLNAVNKANQWYTEELTLMDTEGASMDPAEYRKRVMAHNQEMFKNLPNDPAIRKIYVAAFEDKAPALIRDQAKKHSAYNYEQTEQAFDSYAGSGASANADVAVRSGPSNLAISDTRIDTSIMYNKNDRDIAIKTMLGEAGGESDLGLASVAHVLKNRAFDSRWGGSIASVALAPKQFSTWNKGAGGNNPARFKPGSAAYERAGKIYDAVMDGRTTDPTNGATHYFSPAGMKKLVSDGSQGNLIPGWLKQEAGKSGGQIRIGGHIFVGKSNGRGNTIKERPQGPQLDDISEVDLDTNGWDPAGDEPEYVTDGPKGQEEFKQLPLVVEPGAEPDQVANADGIETQDTTPVDNSEYQANLLSQSKKLKPGRGAALLADNIARTLAAGDTSVLDNSGGLAMIKKLGGSSDDMFKVQKAIEAHENKQEKEYNSQSESWRQDYLDRISKNPDRPFEEWQEEINERFKSGLLSDQEAKSLSRSVAEKLAQQGNRTMMDNPDLRAAVTSKMNLFQQLDPTKMTEDEFLNSATVLNRELIELGKQYGASDSDVVQFSNSVWSEYNSRLDGIRREAKTAHEKAVKNQSTIDRVEERRAKGVNTTGIEGSIEGVDSSGNKRTYTPDQYYINKTKEEVAASFLNPGSNIDPADVGPMVEREAYRRLIKAGIPDKEVGAYMDSVLRGEVVDKKGEIREDARQAFDMYVRVNRMDGGSQYLSQMVSSDTKAFMEQAMTMYEGDTDIDGALTRAKNEQRRTETEPDYARKKLTTYQGAIDQAVKTTVDKALSQDGWWNQLMPAALPGFKEMGNVGRQTIEGAIRRKADALNAANPWMDAEAATKAAGDEIANSTTAIGNGFTVARRPEERLDRVMNIESFGRGGPQDALETYLNEYVTRNPDLPFSETYNAQNSRSWTGVKPPPSYAVTVHPIDPATGKYAMTVHLFKDKDTSKGSYMELNIPDASELGKYYIKKENERSSGGLFLDKVREMFRPSN